VDATRLVALESIRSQSMSHNVNVPSTSLSETASRLINEEASIIGESAPDKSKHHLEVVQHPTSDVGQPDKTSHDEGKDEDESFEGSVPEDDRLELELGKDIVASTVHSMVLFRNMEQRATRLSGGELITLSKDQLDYLMSAAVFHSRRAAREVVDQKLKEFTETTAQAVEKHTPRKRPKTSQLAPKSKKERYEYPDEVQEEVVMRVREILSSPAVKRSTWFKKFETCVWSSIIGKKAGCEHLPCPPYHTVYGWINRVRMTQRSSVVYDGNHDDVIEPRGNQPSDNDPE